MDLDQELKNAELTAKQLEIEKLRNEIKSGKRLSLGSAAVFVTIIGGLSAVAFQGFGFFTSYNEKVTADAQAASDFDFKGLELFVQEKEHLVTCDQDATQKNISLFMSLFSPRITSGFGEIITYQRQECAAASQNNATAVATADAKTTDQVVDAAYAARYTAVAEQSALLAIVAAAPEPDQKSTIYIQIASEGQRATAAALQQALVQSGYKAPGVELVSSAPVTYQVRYYHESQAADASKLAASAGTALGLGKQPRTISLEGRFKSLPEGVMEFWFPKI